MQILLKTRWMDGVLEWGQCKNKNEQMEVAITKRTNSDDKDFQSLAAQLELELKIRDGEDHLFYAQLNKIEKIEHAIIIYEQNEAIGCGAIREYSSDSMEIKRMFVLLQKRGQGIASILLNELENWCRELNYKNCVLETGKNQPEAIRFYQKNSYTIIPNFGRYKNSANSVCFEKGLTLSDE